MVMAGILLVALLIPLLAVVLDSAFEHDGDGP
jgi:hypothetical protein